MAAAPRQRAERKTINTKDGDEIEYDEFFAFRCKSTIDEVDRVLGEHYGLDDEELDAIVNFDIKYRMGQEAAEEE